MKFEPGDRVTCDSWEGTTCIIDRIDEVNFPEDPIAFFVEGGFWRTSRLSLTNSK